MRRHLSAGGRLPPKPLDAAALDALALAYVGRFATSRAKLASYLRRKLRERGWAEGAGAPPDVAAIAERLAGHGYVDDRGFAAARAGALTRRGYGARRIGEALRAAGIAAEDGAEATAVSRAGALAAALTLARRKRIGPYAAAPPTPEARARAVAALVRGGHDLALARRVAAAAPGEALDEEED